MGWQGGHLHEFIINDLHYGEPDPDYPEHDLKNAQRVRLEKALGSAHTFDYLYDYGDAWWHRVTLVERTQFEGPLDSPWCLDGANRSEEHTSELQSLMRISYAVFCLKKKQ